MTLAPSQKAAMIKVHNETEFVNILKENIKPAQPIESADLLQGRAPILRDISRTLASPGMHVFVYGERGVGKTSIALTAARAATSGTIPYVGCDENTTVFSLVHDICETLLDQKLLRRGTDLSGTAGLNVGLFKAEASLKGSPGFQIPRELVSINQATNLLEEAARQRTNEHIVVIDEMDRTINPDFHKGFADLLKRIHDRRVSIRFIMCGVGKNLDAIIGSHLSASRAIAPFEISRISHDARWQIVEHAANKLGFAVGREHIIRMSQISDGYPYYVHLIAQFLFWEIFDHREESTSSSSEDFQNAVAKALEKSEAPLRRAYNFAIQKTTNSTDYEEALWAVAEGTYFERQIKDIYEKSYLNIFEQRRSQIPFTKREGDFTKESLDISAFRRRLYSLCSAKHGSILEKKPNSWYAFKENVIRGYVRLAAQRRDIILGADHFRFLMGCRGLAGASKAVG